MNDLANLDCREYHFGGVGRPSLRSRNWRTRMLGVLIVSLAMPAAALQQPQRKPDRAFPIQTSQREAERTMQLYADCVVGRRQYRPQVDAFLRAAPGTPAYAERGMKLIVPGCMPRSVARSQLRIQPVVLRPALYSAMYRRDFAKAPADIANRARMDYAGEFEAGAAPPAEFGYLREVGDCTSRAQPTQVRALVLTRIASDEEKRTLDALMPAIQQCTPQGATLRFSRTVLRGTLAEGLYKLSKAPVAAPAAG